jgi:DNA excision repair protein ERCC-4
MCSRKEVTKGPYLKKIKKSDNTQRQQLSVLCSLPGIGEKLATRMLERFGSPARTLNASFAELAKVEGLGEARAKKIKQMLESESKLKKRSNQKTLEL